MWIAFDFEVKFNWFEFEFHCRGTHSYAWHDWCTCYLLCRFQPHAQSHCTHRHNESVKHVAQPNTTCHMSANTQRACEHASGGFQQWATTCRYASFREFHERIGISSNRTHFDAHHTTQCNWDRFWRAHTQAFAKRIPQTGPPTNEPQHACHLVAWSNRECMKHKICWATCMLEATLKVKHGQTHKPNPMLHATTHDHKIEPHATT